MASYIKALLQLSGIGADTQLSISDELRSVLANPLPGTSYVITEEYQTVFSEIVDQEDIEVCYGCEVTSVKGVANDKRAQVHSIVKPITREHRYFMLTM